MAAAVCDGADIRRRETGTRSPRAGLAVPGRQDPRDRHPEHRQFTSDVGFRRRACRRASRQYHLCPLHRLWPAYDLAWAKLRFEETGGAPDCTDCDEPVKTATISFGQPMPEDAMRRASELAQHCDLFIAIGSSLAVWPAAGFPLLAKNCGARLVIINNEPTEQDEIADLVIRHDIGETLGPFVGN